MGEVRLKIMQQKFIYVRGSKLKSSGRPEKITLQMTFQDVLRTSSGRFFKTA